MDSGAGAHTFSGAVPRLSARGTEIAEPSSQRTRLRPVAAGTQPVYRHRVRNTVTTQPDPTAMCERGATPTGGWSNGRDVGGPVAGDA